MLWNRWDSDSYHSYKWVHWIKLKSDGTVASMLDLSFLKIIRLKVRILLKIFYLGLNLLIFVLCYPFLLPKVTKFIKWMCVTRSCTVTSHKMFI